MSLSMYLETFNELQTTPPVIVCVFHYDAVRYRLIHAVPYFLYLSGKYGDWSLRAVNVSTAAP